MGLSPRLVEEVVEELLHCRGVYLGMVERKREEGHWRADIECPISTESWNTDSKERQVHRHKHSLQ